MGRPPKGERVLGPYRTKDGWQLVLVGADGSRRYRVFAGETGEVDAKRYRDAAAKLIVRAATTIDEAIDAYERHLKEIKADKASSVAMTIYRLRLFNQGELGRPLSAIPPGWGARRYAWLRGGDELEPGYKKPDGTNLATDTHRNILAEARSFFAWCAEKRWLLKSPLEDVKGVGKRHHGKKQLRVDEARKWIKRALQLARAGEAGAVAALCSLLLGLRASEIVSRVVRDVDDDGRLLWIPDSKTEAGRRTMHVDDLLRPLLLRLAKDRDTDELLFGKHWRDWPREWVQRICRDVGVPKVTAHGMRGLNATLGFLDDRPERSIADALGHEDVKTTKRSYAKAEAVKERQQRRALKVLGGGRRS